MRRFVESPSAARILRIAVVTLAAIRPQLAGAEVSQPPPAPATAREAPRPPPLDPAARGEAPAPPRGPLSLLLHASVYAGLGGGVGFGTRAAGLRATVDWTPNLFLVGPPGAIWIFRSFDSLQISPDLYVRLASLHPTADIGLRAGYRYSPLLGHGLGIGGYVQLAVGRHADLHVSTGLSSFPGGEDRLRERQNLPGVRFLVPGPTLNLGLDLGLAFFP